MKKKKSKLANYLELFLVCFLMGFLILYFKWPNYLFYILGFGILLNIIIIEVKKKA